MSEQPWQAPAVRDFMRLTLDSYSRALGQELVAEGALAERLRAVVEAFLATVRDHGFARGYSGVRISQSGRRFRIEDVCCWNVLDEAGKRVGQAACYPRWTLLDSDEA